MDNLPPPSSEATSPLEHAHVDRIDLPHGTVYLVGTAHVSKASVDLAQETIRTVRPRSVAIELCEARLKALRDPDRWKNMDLVKAIRDGKGHVLLSQLLLAAFQKKLGALTEVRPGAEMLGAAEAAEEIGASVILADRTIRTTLKRVWGHMGFMSAIKLISTVVVGLLTGEQVKPEDIEKLKDKDVLSAALVEFGQVFPDVESTLIAERDQYMAEMIRSAEQFPVVAVIGAGHTPGIGRILREGIPVDRAQLEEIPRPSSTGRTIKWAIPVSVVIFIALGSIRSGQSIGTAMAYSWIIATGATAALGAIIALAHPLTIIVAILVAPFTAINPFLRSGWIAALTEALIRRPRVGDFESILDDMTSLRGWYHNRVCRVLLVMITVNLMGIEGGAIGVPLLARYLW